MRSDFGRTPLKERALHRPLAQPEGRNGSGHKWWAILAPMPTLEPTGIITTSHDAARVLDRPYRVGALSLRPGERQMVEYVRHLDLGWTEIVSWPVIVEGACEGDHWTAVTYTVTPLLHRL